MPWAVSCFHKGRRVPGVRVLAMRVRLFVAYISCFWHPGIPPSRCWTAGHHDTMPGSLRIVSFGLTSDPMMTHRPKDRPMTSNSWMMSRRFETPDCSTDDGIVCHQVHREIAPAKKISLVNQTFQENDQKWTWKQYHLEGMKYVSQ